jgi:hypothetical protein
LYSTMTIFGLFKLGTLFLKTTNTPNNQGLELIFQRQHHK